MSNRILRIQDADGRGPYKPGFSGVWCDNFGPPPHVCPHVYHAYIDEHDDRIVKCLCYWTREFLDAQDRKAVEIDARRV